MGGYGSGRRGRRPTVEGRATLALGVKRVMRPVLAAHRDRSFRLGEIMNAGPIHFALRREGEAEPWAAVDACLRLGPDRGQARLSLEHRAGWRGAGPRDQRVELEAAPCRFGGVRWWWIYPAAGRRAAKLYLPGGGSRFLSRQAHGLAYTSQRGGPDRAGAPAAGGPAAAAPGRPAPAGLRCGTPAKPRWMRRATYERLAAELGAINADLEEAMERMAARFLA
jgi:hypothetical protein